MNKLFLLSVLLACLVAVSSALPEERPKLTVEASRTWNPQGKHDQIKVNQDVWTSKDGKWSAGGYVQHDRFNYGGQRGKDTQGGFQIRGRF